MGRLAKIGMLLAVVAGVLFTYDYVVVRSLERKLDASIVAVEEVYAEIAARDAAAVHAAVPEPDAELEEAFRLAQTVVERSRNPSERITRLNDIVKIQRSLRKILTEASGHAEVVDLPAYAALQHAMGERSQVRDVLHAYNELARRWNIHLRSTVGTASATLSGPRAMLPYLRFDGESEAQQRVGFGG